MNDFNNVSFRGTFRDYQNKVLLNIDKHLQDGKINIVAAPGSGKTILGLEIIRRLGEPALIFSPTVTIRQQWGDRFCECFLTREDNINEFFSYSLKEPKLLTSVTYQSLHSAFNKIKEEPDSGEDEEQQNGQTDYSDFDLIKTIKELGIKTICLDEAHHLRNDWQKSLETFVSYIEKEVKIISLTATPPYDSPPNEWKNYITLCGEIDEEISVPELVKQKTLCPHQDYIFFNYPTKDESNKLIEYRKRADECAGEIINGELFDEILSKSGLLTDYISMEETILENVKGFIAILSAAKTRGTELPKELVKLVSPSGKLPDINLSFAETAFQFVIDNPDIFSKEVSDDLKKELSENRLFERNKVILRSDDRLNRMLVSSSGKLSSISKIVTAEKKALGDSLRMLVLTDYIKKDLIRLIGTEENIDVMSTVTVFETIRRSVNDDTGLAVLSGGLIILPNGIIDSVRESARKEEVGISVKPIANTKHSEAVFSGSNKNKVSIITDAFQKGLINILVGTKALLGEGWDSPCINSLILASFVGSFVLSNQMRGRAIRIDKNAPDKTANIWHLVTAEPQETNMLGRLGSLITHTKSDETIVSGDYDTLVRRFNCFLAPAYNSNVIQSGIERVEIINPPFDSDGFERINSQMLDLASRRQDMAGKWNNALSGKGNPEIHEVSEMPPSVVPKTFIFRNALYETFLGVFLVILVKLIDISASAAGSVFYAALCLVTVYLIIKSFNKLLKFISPKKTIYTLSLCVLRTLKDIGAIESASEVDIESDESDRMIRCSIFDATLHEKKVFAEAMREMLSSIDNPRYLLIKKGRLFSPKSYDFSQSYACPSVIGMKKENVDILLKYLKKVTGTFDCVYTRNEDGRKALLACRKRSYINRNEISIKGRKIVKSRWE